MSRKIVGAVLTGLVAATLCAVPATAENSEPMPASAGFPAPRDSDADGVLDASTTAAALSGAADKDRPVEDLSQRTETFSTVANPDGTFTATEHASPVRVKQGDEWVDIDPTLQKQADGSYKPKAASADVQISGGGSKEAARIAFGNDESFAVAWPQTLPTPTVDGPVATYRLSAATDLLVTATPSGVATHLRLNSQPAADDPAFTFGLTTENLKVKEAPGGGLKVTDGDNAQVGTTSNLVAWDARTDAAGDIAKIVPLEATLSQAKANGDSTKQTLNLQAPAGYLSDPETVYPVIIDPDMNAVNEVRDTYTRVGVATSTGHLPYLMVGREAGSSNANPARTLIQYEATVIAGKTITAASLNFYQYFGGSCSAKNVNIDPLTAEFRATTTVDSNRPAVNKGTGASAVLSANRGPGCTDGSGFVSANITNLAKLWTRSPAYGGLDNWGAQLDVPAVSASDATFERRFCSMEPSTNTAIPCSSAARVPFMKFTYSDPAPATPSAPTAMVSGAVNSVATTVAGAPGGNVRARFEVQQGSTVVYSGYSSFVASGSSASIALPALADGAYTVRAWANDGAASSVQASSVTPFRVEGGLIAGQLSDFSGYMDVAPAVVVDTSTGIGVPAGKLMGGATQTIPIAGAGDVPAGVGAVAVVIHASGSNMNGYLRLAPSDAAAGSTPSTLVYSPGASSQAGAVVKLGVDGALKVLSPTVGSVVDVRVEVVGYFTGLSSDGFVSSTASSIYSTSTAGNSPLAPGETRVISVGGVAGVPEDGTVGSIAATVTARNWTSTGSLTVYNPDYELPTSASIRVDAGHVDAGSGSAVSTLVPLSLNREIAVHNSGTAPMSVDIESRGWFTRPVDGIDLNGQNFGTFDTEPADPAAAQDDLGTAMGDTVEIVPSESDFPSETTVGSANKATPMNKLKCNNYYEQTDSRGQSRLQRKCGSSKVIWQYQLAPSIRALAGKNIVNESGMKYSNDNVFVGQNGSHIEGVNYLWHGTFTGVSSAHTVVWYDSFKFRHNVAGGGNALVQISGSFRYINN